MERDRACLTYHSQLSLFFFSLLSKISNKKHFNFFTLFISHQSYFITIKIKKPTKKQNFFHFSIKHSIILYPIHHFLLYNTQIFQNTITYQTGTYFSNKVNTSFFNRNSLEISSLFALLFSSFFFFFFVKLLVLFSKSLQNGIYY
jgi:hypothetical protein